MTPKWNKTLNVGNNDSIEHVNSSITTIEDSEKRRKVKKDTTPSIGSTRGRTLHKNTLRLIEDYYCACASNCNEKITSCTQQCRGKGKTCSNYVNTMHSLQYLCKDCINTNRIVLYT